MSKLWGGRFTEEAEAWVEEFGASISFDQQLVNQDIKGYCTRNDASKARHRYERRGRENKDRSSIFIRRSETK
ncbi:hypothetical protein GNE09_07750 [Bacillus cereus]|nr:hypothetical protein GNE09_07750 [Bacillus cereus]